MKRVLIIIIVLQFAGTALQTRADVPQVLCVGTESGGSGPRRYAYEVDAGSLGVMAFAVGTKDLNRNNYTNVLVPDNWNFIVEEVGMTHAHGTKTPHGSMSGPCWCLTWVRVQWWTEDPNSAVGSFVFGYDHPWVSEDVGWAMKTEAEGIPPESPIFRLDWSSPVGTGSGPVHGPYIPEPATAGLLLLGGLAMLRRR